MWRTQLAKTLATANNCDIFASRLRFLKIVLVGVPSDTAVVREMFQFLTGEIDRLTLEYLGNYGGGKRAGNSFRWGAVVGIAHQITEAKRQARIGVASTALVLVDRNSERVVEAMKELDLNKAPPVVKATVDPDAYLSGCVAGSGLKMSQAPALGESYGGK
jgi:hypothetical protein